VRKSLKNEFQGIASSHKNVGGSEKSQLISQRPNGMFFLRNMYIFFHFIDQQQQQCSKRSSNKAQQARQYQHSRLSTMFINNKRSITI